MPDYMLNNIYEDADGHQFSYLGNVNEEEQQFVIDEDGNRWAYSGNVNEEQGLQEIAGVGAAIKAAKGAASNFKGGMRYPGLSQGAGGAAGAGSAVSRAGSKARGAGTSAKNMGKDARGGFQHPNLAKGAGGAAGAGSHVRRNIGRYGAGAGAAGAAAVGAGAGRGSRREEFIDEDGNRWEQVGNVNEDFQEMQHRGRGRMEAQQYDEGEEDDGNFEESVISTLGMMMEQLQEMKNGPVVERAITEAANNAARGSHDARRLIEQAAQNIAQTPEQAQYIGMMFGKVVEADRAARGNSWNTQEVTGWGAQARQEQQNQQAQQQAQQQAGQGNLNEQQRQPAQAGMNGFWGSGGGNGTLTEAQKMSDYEKVIGSLDSRVFA